MSRIHVREFTVPEAAMDVNRHVNNLEYLRPAFAGDELRLATWVADLRPRSSLRRAPGPAAPAVDREVADA